MRVSTLPYRSSATLCSLILCSVIHYYTTSKSSDIFFVVLIIRLQFTQMISRVKRLYLLVDVGVIEGESLCGKIPERIDYPLYLFCRWDYMCLSSHRKGYCASLRTAPQLTPLTILRLTH